MTTIASAVLFRSESKGSGFHDNERSLSNRQNQLTVCLHLLPTSPGHVKFISEDTIQ